MNLARINALALLFAGFTAIAQTGLKESSRILRSYPSDTAALHVEMTEVDYDYQKNKLPFYIVSNPSNYNETSVPTLIPKTTRVIGDPHAAVIKKYFSSYIKAQFIIEELSSLSKNQNLNQYKIFPFRLNALNQLEELITYDVNWQVTKNNNLAAREAASFVSTSVLSTGNWYKIGVTQTGIHRITRSFFQSIGINTNALDPKKIRIFGNGGKMVPELNGSFRHDDLQENAIRVVLAADSSFDYALFYATGPTEWVSTNSKSSLKFRAKKNLYSDTSFYYINVDQGNGKRIVTKPSLSQTPDVTTSTYDYYNYHEVDAINFGKSGRDFYGEYFDLTTSYSFPWNDGDFVIPDTLMAEATIAATHVDTSGFSLAGNGLNLHLTTSAVGTSQYANYANVATRFGKSINTNPGSINLTITKLTQRSTGWLDKLTINTRRNLILRTKQFSFRDSRVTKYMNLPNPACKFVINVANTSTTHLWNISDPLNPTYQAYNVNGSGIEFTAYSDSLNEYCICPSTDFFTPVYVGKVVNQNLHSITQANYLIITHPLFLKEAQRMGAFHQQKDGLTYAVATTDQIYNEFGSGKPDISAIRDFIRMVYSRNISLPETQQLKYVLLMGDGSFNNKNRSLVNNSNLIPTYQSHQSLHPVESIVTDDFYGLMDPNEGYLAEFIGKMDVAIGRFTCKTVTEVRAVITKIESYYSTDPNFVTNNTTNTAESVMGDWRNWLLFLGDDGDQALHMIQSDSLVRIVKRIAPDYNVENILLDAYQRLSTPGGNRFPDAADDFLKRIKKGTLIFNYTGHGGEVGLTAERMIDLEIINNMDNFKKLPLFITATCEFSKFDDPARTSAGELCLLNPKGGSIALYTTCRVAYAHTNLTLNAIAIEKLFTRLPNGKWPTLGDAMLLTKAMLSQSTAYANFHLLGDPALTLSYPEQKVYTSKINNVAVSPTKKDTLSALSKITISGFVADQAGNKLTNFNGLVYPTVFDKEQLVATLMNDNESAITMGIAPNTYYAPFQFKLQKNILYRGKSQATNGDFSFTFIVPKDISFAIGPGRISYYATDGNMDASGNYTQLLVGGAASNTIMADNDGPVVDLYLNDKNFVNGGITNEKPLFFADLVDSTGINTLGSSIGHDISVILDENSSKPVVLNDYYEANLNSYQSGRVRYPYSQISDGEHRLTFKVWDIQNNSTTATLDFVVAKSAELALNHVLNYPNPFTTRTKFMFKHNQACNPLKVTVQIYTVSGKVVKTIQTSTTCEDSVPEGIEWDGKDDYGDKLARGVYIYKLAILDVDNKKAEKIEKLVILN